jgi:hypothetical protein
MNLGVPGPAGSQGPAGSNGQGVAAGGLVNQVLVKLSNDDFDTGWANAGTGDYLPLTGGTLSGEITFSTDGTNDSVVGAFGLGVEDINGYTAYVEPTQIRIYNGDYVNGTSLTPNGINFNDDSTQTTAYNPSVLNGYLPLTGGTLTGSLALSDDVFGSGVSKTISANAVNGDSYSGYEIGSNNADSSQGSALKIKFGNTNEGYENQAILSQGGLTIMEAISGNVYASYESGGITYTNGGTISGDLTCGGDLNLDQILKFNNINNGITFGDNSVQTTAWLGYNGTTSQYITGTGSLVTFPPLGDRYLTSSTTTLTCDSGNGKTMTVGTGLSYSRQQDITVSYDTANHMHGTVLTYNSTTGVMTFDSNTHSGGGTYSSWEVNVGGVAGAILPVGGTTGQVLAKINSTNFNTEWVSLGSASTLASSAVLQTANNLSDLSSSSTARTNLGLGSMATQSTSAYLSSSAIASNYQTQSGMSAYLSTASAVANYLTISSASSTYQTQSGMSAYLSTASAVANYLTISNASSTYQTQSGMSAYLSTSAAASIYQTQSGMSAYLSTASASSTYLTQSNASSTYLTQSNAASTYIGTSAYATNLQAVQNTSTSTVLSPANSRFAGATTNIWIPGVTGLSSAVSGTGANAGSSVTSLNGNLIAPNSTTAGYATRGFTLSFPSNSVNAGYNYGTASGHSVRVYYAGWATAVTGVKMRSVFGRMGGTLPTPGTLASRGYGWEWDFSAKTISIIAHNGTSLTTTAQTWTPVSFRTYEITVTSNGSGTVSLYIDGTLIGTGTGAPTDTNATAQLWWQMEIENQATAGSQQTITYSNPKVITTNG